MATKLTTSDVNTWYKRLNAARTQSGIGLGPLTESNYTALETSKRIKALVSNISSSISSNSFLKLADNFISNTGFEINSKITERDKQKIDNTTISLLRVCPNVNCQTVCTNTGANSNIVNTNGTCGNVTQSNGYNGNGTCGNGGCGNGVNGNGICGNGTCSNGANANGANGNGTCSNGTYNVNATFSNGGNSHGSNNNDGDKGTHGNGTNSNGIYSNVAHGNGSNSNGANSNVTKSNGSHSNGANSNATKSNGANSNGTNSNGTKTNGNTNAIYDPNTVTYSAKNHYTEQEALNRVK